MVMVGFLNVILRQTMLRSVDIANVSCAGKTFIVLKAKLRNAVC